MWRCKRLSAWADAHSLCARSVEEVLALVSMGGSASNARSVEVPASVSTDGGAISARSVQEAASISVSMGGGAVIARSVEVQVSASIGGYAVGARSVEEAASTSMGGYAVGTRIAKVCVLNAAHDSLNPLFVVGETPPGCEPLTDEWKLHPVEHPYAGTKLEGSLEGTLLLEGKC